MNKRRKKKKRYKIKNILMLVIIIFLIVKLFSVLINSGKDNKDEIVKKSEPKTYLNKVNKTDNYNEDIDKDIQNTIVKYMDSYFKSITTLKEVDMTNLFCDDSYEEAYINQWRDKCGMSVEMIALAYEYCILATNKLSFQYMDSIIRNWKKAGISTVEAAEKDHEDFKNKNKNKPAPKKFSDKDSSVYKSGGTDYSDFERRMNAKY